MSLRSLALRRAVGPGVLASLVGTGVICYYRYHANNRTLPFAVHAEGEKVSCQTLKLHTRKFLSSKLTANRET